MQEHANEGTGENMQIVGHVGERPHKHVPQAGTGNGGCLGRTDAMALPQEWHVDTGMGQADKHEGSIKWSKWPCLLDMGCGIHSSFTFCTLLPHAEGSWAKS